MRWPRPEHFDSMSTDQFHGYIRAIGIEAEAQAVLAEYRGEDHQTEAVTDLRSSESSPERRSGAALP